MSSHSPKTEKTCVNINRPIVHNMKLKSYMKIPSISQSSLLCVCFGFAFIPLALAESIEIPNAGFESPSVPDVTNVSFDGSFGNIGKVPGWESNEPGHGGIIRIDEKFPGRAGQNVMYLHGTEEQSFHTAEYDLGVELQSDMTYVLSFDVLRWQEVTKDDLVIFTVGLYTGVDYDSRVPLKQFSGEILLVDQNNNPADKIRVTLVYTSGTVAPGTKFWIGGDASGNADDSHRTHFDNFTLDTETRP